MQSHLTNPEIKCEIEPIRNPESKLLTKTMNSGIRRGLHRICCMESGVATYLAKSRRGKIRWRLLDAEGWVLGRLAARASRVLTGKAAADFTPHADHRDGVIIINAEKIRLTGKKLDQKLYRHYTGYPGGLREISARKVMATRPERILG